MAEYKGSFDLINCLNSYILKHQQGYGVVAVSPRYADQILDKLPVFWKLDRKKVVGVLNALYRTDSLAADVFKAGPEKQSEAIEEVMWIKAQAKSEFQAKFGLRVDPEAELICFLGRMTHQKGCDIIALAADFYLANSPKAQLVMVGILAVTD